MAFIGQSIRRFEDGRFLTGQGRYVTDIDMPGALHMAVVRSPHAHARVVAIDTGAALALTGDDLAWHLPCPAQIGVPIAMAERPVLAQGVVRHVGEPVAFVFAETMQAARDAAEAVVVEYDMLPANVDPLAAFTAAPIHAFGNQAFEWQKGDAAATDAAFAQAAHITRLTIANQRVTCAPIEPRAAIAQPDGTLIVNGQAVHGMRRQLAQCMGLDEAGLRVVTPDVGGGFGVKNVPFPEHAGLLHMARVTGRPCRWVAEQTDDFAASAHGRGMHSQAALARDGLGRFLALRIDAVAEMGAYLSPNGPSCCTNAAGTAFGGGYAIPAIRARMRGAYTNTAPIEAYRGAGKPEANHIIEMLIEAAARQHGFDAGGLRARNLIAGHPHVTAMGMTIADGQFPANLAAAEALADRDGFAARRAGAPAAGRLRGLGVTCFMETARGAFGEWARARLGADGRIELALGSHSNGQGHETSFRQIAADHLGLPMDSFDYVQGDTSKVAKGGGHGGARSLHQGGRALVEAMDALIEAARPLAARLLQASEVQFRGGAFHAGDAAVALTALGPLEAVGEHDSALCTFPHGAHVAEVEIDADTGQAVLCRYIACDDYGTIVNPMLTIGQVQGGLAQGIGQALLERIDYDGDGQLRSATFMDYTLPRAADLPALDVRLQPGCPASVNPLGVKGVGQAGCIAAPQAVMAALLDAMGGQPVDMPATPEAIWRALNAQ
ncbi:MAG: xanthine dehydrogenase family protein molybdopterin-binding subunit [Rubritepida sp.]|nr:xanthine dehydrogenase family protein molybdopterin-binding subunit [Rubritepida sp.]